MLATRSARTSRSWVRPWRTTAASSGPRTGPGHGAAAISPNGTRLYYYATDDHRVRALDLEHPRNVGPDFFPELAASGAIDPPGSGAQMLLTPDGGSLIIAGKDRLIVMPTP